MVGRSKSASGWLAADAADASAFSSSPSAAHASAAKEESMTSLVEEKSTLSLSLSLSPQSSFSTRGVSAQLMELFQCVVNKERKEEDTYQPRMVRSADRDLTSDRKQYYHTVEMRPRGRSLPAGYYTTPAGSGGSGEPSAVRPNRLLSRSRTLSNRSGGSSSGGGGGGYSGGGIGGSGGIGRGGRGSGGFRHWGSSLSIESENSAGDLTSRTLRPATPVPSLHRRDDVYHLTAPKAWLPETRPEDVRHPELADYLRQPRLVSTLGCLKAQQQSRSSGTSEFHARRLASGERPPYRNLRLGGFMDKKEQDGDDELIPEMLRLYYLDTYLDTYEYDYLNNFGDAGDDSQDKKVVIHRGM